MLEAWHMAASAGITQYMWTKAVQFSKEGMGPSYYHRLALQAATEGWLIDY